MTSAHDLLDNLAAQLGQAGQAINLVMSDIPGDQPDERLPGPYIEPADLVAMFRRAAQKGPCPDERILADFPLLTSVGWVPQLIDEARKHEATEELAEQALRRIVESIRPLLEPVIKSQSRMTAMGFPNFTLMRLGPLYRLYEIVPQVLNSLEPKRRISPIVAWHVCAEAIAFDAMRAWRLAGRKRFGLNLTSPLVMFVQDFLCVAGEDREPGTVAAVFRRGLVARRAKQPTGSVL